MVDTDQTRILSSVLVHPNVSYVRPLTKVKEEDIRKTWDYFNSKRKQHHHIKKMNIEGKIKNFVENYETMKYDECPTERAESEEEEENANIKRIIAESEKEKAEIIASKTYKCTNKEHKNMSKKEVALSKSTSQKIFQMTPRTRMYVTKEREKEMKRASLLESQVV